MRYPYLNPGEDIMYIETKKMNLDGNKEAGVDISLIVFFGTASSIVKLVGMLGPNSITSQWTTKKNFSYAKR